MYIPLRLDEYLMFWNLNENRFSINEFSVNFGLSLVIHFINYDLVLFSQINSMEVKQPDRMS
jgi:hypothetical protein